MNTQNQRGVTVTLYLEVISSWCHFAEPAWDDARARFANDVTFDWRIALMSPDAYPATRAQADWFYRRSGTIVGAPSILHSGWLDSRAAGTFLAPNLVAEAARAMGATDDRVRRAIAHAALHDGKAVGDLDVSVDVAAEASGLDRAALRRESLSAETTGRIEASTAEFHAMGATQRPTWVITSDIGDRVMLSGTWRAAPAIATIQSVIDDLRAYRSYAAHHGTPPSA